MGEINEPLRVSRVGKRAVSLPQGVSVSSSGGTVTVKGPKGSLERALHPEVTLLSESNSVRVAPSSSASRRFSQFQGLTWSLLRSMVHGVSEGYRVSMDLYGVGYRATLAGQELTLSLGLSHQVVHPLHPNVKARVETIDEAGTKRPRLHLESHDKEALGQTAAKLRSYRPPEPYKGKGVRYTGEKVREKAGKAGGK
jgi:large subunit ribosomal protein L6